MSIESDDRIPDWVNAICDRDGYTEPFLNGYKWWAYPPNGVMPVPIPIGTIVQSAIPETSPSMAAAMDSEIQGYVRRSQLLDHGILPVADSLETRERVFIPRWERDEYQVDNARSNLVSREVQHHILIEDSEPWTPLQEPTSQSGKYYRQAAKMVDELIAKVFTIRSLTDSQSGSYAQSADNNPFPGDSHDNSCLG